MHPCSLGIIDVKVKKNQLVITSWFFLVVVLLRLMHLAGFEPATVQLEIECCFLKRS